MMKRAWLMLAAGSDRQHAGNDGYDDAPGEHYSWDDTVANHALPKPGDMIVLWDKETTVGTGIIERIDEGKAEKNRLRCPRCKKTNLKERKTFKPPYRCARPDCNHKFVTPVQELIKVHTYRSLHVATWVEIPGALSAAVLRPLCLQPKSQQSIRQLDWERFLEALDRPTSFAINSIAQAPTSWIEGGHRETTVRVRRGQQRFRKDLLSRFGSICAFTGPAPTAALEAAHLYSFASEGMHHKHGGVLLRRDVHHLFDRGLLAIDPTTLRVDVHMELNDYPIYAALHGRSLFVEIGGKEARWVELHWRLHRR